jgi:Tol biopolymer transport system component
MSLLTMKASLRVARVARPTHRRFIGLLAALPLVAGVAVGAAAGLADSPAAVGTIVFVSDRDGNLEIYSMRADGTHVARLTRNRARDVVPAWSPNGRKIAFTSNRDGNRELYVMNADGSDQRRLTHNPARDLFPTWSPDGQRIAFSRESKRGTFAGPIHVVNADGSGERKLTEIRNADCCLAWSPNGASIAYVGDDLQIYLLSPDGTGQRRLTRNNASDCCPAWSPDGTKIAFASNRKGGDGKYRIYVMTADGSRQRQVARLLGIRPTFSPDGRRLAFGGLPPGARLFSKSTEIFVIKVSGASLQRLTKNAAEDAFPTWRPSK